MHEEVSARGLELGSGSRVVVQLVNLEAPMRAAGAGPIVDACTNYCDRSADKALAICDQGTLTYECGCDAESRTGKFTCHRKI